MLVLPYKEILVMEAVLILNILVSCFLCFIWTKKTWFNVFMKFILFVMFLSNGILLAEYLGYLVKAH